MASINELINLHNYKYGRPQGGKSALAPIIEQLGNRSEDKRSIEKYRKQSEIQNEFAQLAEQRQNKEKIEQLLALAGIDPTSFQKDQPPQGAAMSLPGGEYGDVQGRPLARQTQGTPLQRLAEVSAQNKVTENKEAKAVADKRTFDIAEGLRKEFTSSPVYKDFQEISRAAKNIESSYQRSISPDTQDKLAVDQSLVVSFNKLLDPGSVVRESEFARTPQGQALIRSYQGRVQQLYQGGVGLTPQGRLEIKQMADDLLKNSQETVRKQVGVYENLANQFGVPKEMVFGGMNEGFENQTSGVSNFSPAGVNKIGRFTIEVE